MLHFIPKKRVYENEHFVFANHTVFLNPKLTPIKEF